MQQWTDLFLNKPLPEGWMQGLLFITFGLHLLFVLLMLGTAILSLLFFLRDLLRQPSPDQHWNEHVAHSHMGLKSLAVVLGVAPPTAYADKPPTRLFYGYWTFFVCMAGDYSLADHGLSAV